MPDGHAQEFARFVRHLQEPARPAPRIAGDLGIGEVADDRQCLCAGGRPVRQFNALVVRHGAIAEAQMEEVERHDPSPVQVPFKEENGRLYFVPSSVGRQAKKLAALSRRSDRRPLQEAYHKSLGLLTTEGKLMRSKSDHAWRMAAQCAKLAQNADEKDEREFYVRMRDSWITGGQSIRVPRRRRRARRAERAASQSRRAIHPLSREPQPGTATRAGRAPLRASHLPLVPAKAGTQILKDRLDSQHKRVYARP